MVGTAHAERVTPHRILVGLMIASAMTTVQLMIVALAARGGVEGSSLATVTPVAVLPLATWAVLAAASMDHRRSRQTTDLLAHRRLAARAAAAEAALARSQERTHELKATLSSLRLSHQLLVDPRAALTRPMRWRLERLHDAELARVERLLSAARGAGVTAVALDDVLGSMADAMGLRGCDVRWHRTGSLAQGCPDDVTEILHVLLDNAARHGTARAVEVRTASTGGWVEVHVRDGGPGVPAALAGVVFDRGVRAEGSDGDGLGLHVARRLARSLGGDLWLEPALPSGGAEFALRLPAATRPVPCPAPRT